MVLKGRHPSLEDSGWDRGGLKGQSQDIIEETTLCEMISLQGPPSFVIKGLIFNPRQEKGQQYSHIKSGYISFTLFNKGSNAENSLPDELSIFPEKKLQRQTSSIPVFSLQIRRIEGAVVRERRKVDIQTMKR